MHAQVPDADPVHASWLIKYGHLVGNCRNTAAVSELYGRYGLSWKSDDADGYTCNQNPTTSVVGVRQNTGDFNVGDYNKDDYNIGDCNNGQENLGDFNTHRWAERNH